MNNIGDAPAYPVIICGVQYSGLTKREKIAALQMQALITNTWITSSSNCDDVGRRAKLALTLADALLVELAKEVKE